jgi:phenylacetate-CoA ligase
VTRHIGYPLAEAVHLLEQSEDWSPEQMRAHQNQAFRHLVEHCYRHVPYYSDWMTTEGLAPSDFQRIEDLDKFPYLTREILRDQGDRLRAENYPEEGCQFRQSGGTTGEPIRVAVDPRARGFETGAYLRGMRWMKWQWGRPMVRLFGGSLGLSDETLWTRFRAWVLYNRFLPAFELSPDNLAEYLKVIHQARGGVLVGYASVVRNLAEYMAAEGLQGSPLESVICTAEYMPEQWRREIEKALEAPVFCYYGCGEVHSLGYECDGEEGYLVPEEHIVLEVEGDHPGKLRREGRGQACITTLYNHAMPLIRYLNGDMLELSSPREGRAHLRITDLEGRVVDQLLDVNGVKVSGTLPPHIIHETDLALWKYQVVQTGLDRLVFHYRLENGGHLSSKAKRTLECTFQKCLGEGLRVEFVEGDFETTGSGKHRFVINRLLS